MAETVAITSATARTGRLLLPRLRERGYRTLALVRAPVELPADEVVSDWMRAPRAAAALAEADLVVHLPGDLRARGRDGYQRVHVRTAERVAAAMRSGRARRAVCIGYVGAQESSSNAYLATKAAAERILRESGKELVTFRCTAILDTPEDPGPIEQAFTAHGGTVRILGDGSQRQRPIFRADVAEAVLAALTRGRPGTYDLAGPEEMSLAEFVQVIQRGAPARILPTPAWQARLLGRMHPELTPAAVEVMLADCTADPSAAVAEFGLTLTPLTGVWAPPAESDLSGGRQR